MNNNTLNNLIKKMEKMINNIYLPPHALNPKGPIPSQARRRNSINKQNKNRKNLIKKTIPSSPLKRKYSSNNIPKLEQLKIKKKL